MAMAASFRRSREEPMGILSRRHLEVAADDAARWVPRGSEYHRPDDVGVAAVAVIVPPAYRADLRS